MRPPNRGQGKNKKKKGTITKAEELEEQTLPTSCSGTADDYSFRELALIKEGYYKTEVPKQIALTRHEIAAVEKKLRALPKHGLYFHEIKELERQLAALHEQMNRLSSGVDQAQYCHRLRQLIRSLESIQPASEWKKQEHANDSKRTAKQLFVAEFFPDLTVPTFVHKDQCLDCGHALLLNKTQALLECPSCGLCNVYINTTNSAVAWSQTPALQKHEYNQMKWMYKQLSQYRIGSRKIPISVIYAVKRRLLASHQKTAQTVSHTPIREALRELGYREYTNSASKIADIINCKTVAEFTDEQFVIVIQRMLAIQTVYFMVRNEISRRNFPHQNFLLHTICTLEKWWALSTCFTVQKTTRVAQKQKDEWYKFLPYLQRYDLKHTWFYPESHPHLSHLGLIRR